MCVILIVCLITQHNRTEDGLSTNSYLRPEAPSLPASKEHRLLAAVESTVSKNDIAKLISGSASGGNSTGEEETVAFNMTEYLLNRLPKAPTPTERTCRLSDGGGMDRNFKILVFVDNCYFSLFTNWYYHYLDVCGLRRKSQLEVVCMDTEVSLSLYQLGLNCSVSSFVMPNYHSYKKKQAMVWIKRLEVILHYLESSIDLLLTDTDAIWRSDPFPFIQPHLSTSHVIASRGNFPSIVSSKYGATICMGFAYFKASMFSLTLMRAVLQEMKYDRPDDQYAINMVLDKWNIQYPYRLDLEYNTVAHTGHVVAADQEHNITLLAHDQFIRNCTRLPKATNIKLTKSSIDQAQVAVADATVAHCVFTAGNAYTKFLSIRAYRLWHVDVPMLDPTSIIPTPGCIVRSNNTAGGGANGGGNEFDADGFPRRKPRRRQPSWSFVGQAAAKVEASVDANEDEDKPRRRHKRNKHNKGARDDAGEDGNGEEDVTPAAAGDDEENEPWLVAKKDTEEDNADEDNNNNNEEAEVPAADEETETNEEPVPATPVRKRRPFQTIGGGFKAIQQRAGALQALKRDNNVVVMTSVGKT